MKKFLSVNTKKWASINESTRSSGNYSNSQSVGIVFCTDSREKHDIVKKFKKRLENDGKKVSVLTFLPDKKENHEFLFDYFTEKDISFWGKYKSEQVLQFIEKDFDYLFHVDFKSIDEINGILALSKAKCRVGGANIDQNKYYELIITPQVKDLQNLVDEMYNYISILN